MENRNLDRALDIISSLLKGDEVGKCANTSLYEEYSHNGEVYDITEEILKKLDLKIYEYNDSLFLCATEGNRVFGFSNEELKKLMGLKLNRELYLVYFIIYGILTEFYKDTAESTYLTYIKIEDVIRAVGGLFSGVINDNEGFELKDKEKDSFRALALLWDELPDVSKDDTGSSRSSKNSHTGYVKLTFNFLISQRLFMENDGKYYPTDRFRAIATGYFEDNRGRFYELMKGKGEHNAAD